ncbi:glycerate kinase [Enterococcus gallinarum]|uniref:glycerate kinase n=1 Tax=Enterococcus gallinarum TaxID=1353 RepID=UPI002DB85E14|nr:glycerate kinase [Enterococcus gallinarum]
MKVIAMIDSFKGSATSEELNQAALKGFPVQWEKESIPIADGGEGNNGCVICCLWRTV